LIVFSSKSKANSGRLVSPFLF